MTQKLTPGTAVLLVVPPLLWAGNAVTGRLVHDLIPPITLNFIRWILAFLVLLPLAYQVLRPGSPLWPHWRRYALLGLLGIGAYNALQYMALQTSTPINVTLVGSSMPVWMLAVGALFFGAVVTRRQLLGALLSMCGVLLVLSRGEWSQLLAFRLVPGDVFMLLATISWAFYSWLLARTSEPARLRSDWAAHADFLQVMVGAVCELTWRLLPGIRQSGAGRILNVASFAALLPSADGQTLYAPAKAFMVKFSESLALENADAGVHATALCPGFTRSEFHDVTGTREMMSKLPRWLWLVCRGLWLGLAGLCAV